MEANKKTAEDALKKAGGGGVTTGAPGGGKVTTNPGGRNADRSFTKEGCSQDDPTTSGCISPRMLNPYKAARSAGYTHYTSCYRSGGSGDHPLGKASDFSSNRSTFVNARASGADKTYGDNLAAWCVANAKNLGVKYVIWYKRIGQPSSGWKSYGGDGTPERAVPLHQCGHRPASESARPPTAASVSGSTTLTLRVHRCGVVQFVGVRGWWLLEQPVPAAVRSAIPSPMWEQLIVPSGANVSPIIFTVVFGSLGADCCGAPIARHLRRIGVPDRRISYRPTG